MNRSLPREQRIAWVVIAGVTTIMTGVLYLFDPAATRMFPPCPTYRLLGLYCPGCGALRAVHLLLNGCVVEAFHMNPGLVVLLPFLAALLVRPKWAYKPWVAWMTLGILILYGIARNLPFRPFHLLAPH